MRDLLQNVSQIQTKGRLVGGACVRGAKNRDIINFYEIFFFGKLSKIDSLLLLTPPLTSRPEKGRPLLFSTIKVG